MTRSRLTSLSRQLPSHHVLLKLVFLPGACVTSLATCKGGARGHPGVQRWLRHPQPVFIPVLLMSPKTFRECTGLVVVSTNLGSWQRLVMEAMAKAVHRPLLSKPWHTHSRVRGNVGPHTPALITKRVCVVVMTLQ